MDENSPLSKLEVRQAISYAIDRDTLCSALGPKFYTPALQMYPEPFKGVLPDSYNCTYDPDKAKELLAEAGYPDGIEINFFVPPSMDKDAMIAVSKMLGDAGIQCDMQFPEAAWPTTSTTKGGTACLRIPAGHFPTLQAPITSISTRIIL
jgi:peptide/nickel transport system substrate-binding protein